MQAAPGFKVASSQVRFPSLAVPCFSILQATNAGCGTIGTRLHVGSRLVLSLLAALFQPTPCSAVIIRGRA